jgi:hypothetical protein
MLRIVVFPYFKEKVTTAIMLAVGPESDLFLYLKLRSEVALYR